MRGRRRWPFLLPVREREAGVAETERGGAGARRTAAMAAVAEEEGVAWRRRRGQ
jgi:hypothetical protein